MRALLVIVMALVACASKPQPSRDDVERAAAGAYAADHLWCVQRFATDPEIDACRAAVRRRWGMPARDGG